MYIKHLNMEIDKNNYFNITARQGDSARYLLFNLLDNGVPFSLVNRTVRAYAIKPDGTKVFNDLTIINATNGQAELQLTTQMLAVVGNVNMELVIYEGTSILSTTAFALEVGATNRSDSAVISTNEFSALTNAIASIDKLEATYSPRLLSLESQLVDIITLDPTGTNDTLTWNNAINSLTNGGIIELTEGDYFIDIGILKSNITIRARGRVRILSDVVIFLANSGSSDVNNNISNIIFDGLIFEHITKTFEEWTHIMNLGGVSNISIKNCTFKGFKGDGLYLSGGGVGTETHNENVFIERCIFDGVNFQNRNGVSIVDGTNINIINCIFKNCSKSGMPGAIDIEPNANDFHIIKNILIKNNKFTNIGGSVGVIGLFLNMQQSQYITPVGDIVIDGNVIDGVTGTAIYLRQDQTTPIDNTSTDLNIKVINNVIKNMIGKTLYVVGIKNVTISKNEFYNCTDDASIGYTDINNKCIDVKLCDNIFKKCGTTTAVAMSIFTIDKMDIINNKFDDCGKTDGSVGRGIYFFSGTTSNIRIIENDFISPTGKLTVAILKGAGHTFTPNTNSFYGNTLNGLSNDFKFIGNEKAIPTYFSEALSYTPMVAGATGLGTATYSEQTGFYTQIGKMITYEVSLAWTGHTGTGQTYINSPSLPNTNSISNIPVNIVSSFALPAGSQLVGLINKTNGRVYLYTCNAGILSALNVPSSGTVYISGRYITQ